MNNKLTAERAQERIAHLKQWQAQRGLTLREEEYLEAMEIAARVLSVNKTCGGCDGEGRRDEEGLGDCVCPYCGGTGVEQ